MKKILVCSPVRGGMSPNYVRSTIALLNSTLCRGENRPYSIDFAWTSGTSVAMARDENANVFMQRGDDELIQWDVDLGVTDPQLMVSMFNRLLSHDVDLVGGAYVGHNFISQFHGAAAQTEVKLRADGLLPMSQIPLGFSKTKRRVFEGIKDKNPHLTYQMKETTMKKARQMFEYFPNGIVGPNSGQGKVDRIKALLPVGTVLKEDEMPKKLEQVLEIIGDNDFSQNIMLGEDFYFCRLAREAGFNMFIDNNLIIPHESHVRLPVKNQLILEEILQQWRWVENAKEDEIKSLVEKLRTKLIPDIP